MSFEKIYEKYRKGTATEEEAALVEEEIAKARKLGEILETGSRPETVLTEADVATVKKAKKRHTLKTLFTTILIVFAAMAIVTGAVLGGVFGTATSSAKKNVKVGADEAKQIVLEFYKNNYTKSGSMGEPFVKDFERDVEMTKNLKNCYYRYTIEVDQPGGYEIEFEVDSRTGMIKVVDWGND